MSTSGSLHITASQGFAEEMLSPIIPEFHTCYPDIQIDLVEHGIDIAFRAGQLDDSSFNYRKMGSLQSSVYAAPQLAKQCGDGMELTQLPCLIDNNLHANTRWPVDHSFNQNNYHNLAVHAVLKRNSPRLLRQLTLSAVGASYIPDIIAEQYVKKGLLQKLDVGFTPLKYPLHAFYRGGDWQPERVKVFLDFVTSKLGTSS